MKNLIGALRDYFLLLSEGHTLKDKVSIFLYLLKSPTHLINKNHSTKFLFPVTIKNKDGLFADNPDIFTACTVTKNYEKQLRRYFKVDKEGCFIDVGANVGKYTVLVGKDMEERVISIEPNPKNAKILRKNVGINNLKNVLVVEKACYYKRGKMKLWLDKKGTGGNSLDRQLIRDEYVEVEVDTLDNIAKEAGIKKVGFMKIDIEHNEDNVLRGAKKILKRDHPKIIFEAYTEPESLKIKRSLNIFGYKIRKIDKFDYLAV